MNREKMTFGVAFAAVALLMGGRAALASWSISNLSQDAATGEYQYTVEISATTTPATVNDGDGFVIYDFPDLVTSGPDDWSLTGLPAGLASNLVLSQQDSGNAINPLFNSLVTDDPNIPNLSFEYDDATAFTVPDETEYTGTLTLYTSDTGPGVTTNTSGWAAAEDQTTGNQYFDGHVDVPVPEPTTLGLLALVGSALLGGRRLRKAGA